MRSINLEVKFELIFGIIFFMASYNCYSQVDATIRGVNVNIRSCAELNCGVLFQLNNGDQCELLFNIKDENVLGYGINSWYKINHNGVEGYVYGAFLNFNSDEVKLIKYNSNLSTITIDRNEINARVGGSMTCSKAFQLNKGDVVRILGKTNDYAIESLGSMPWYQVEFNGMKGYVYSYFLDCQNCSFQTNLSTPLPPSPNPNFLKGTIIGDNVNVRDCPNTNCTVSFQMNLDENCKVIKEITSSQGLPSWYEIHYNNQTGYVHGDLISVQGSTLKKVKVWALIAGVADYSFNSNLRGVTDLNYSSDDAKRIYQFLKSPEGGNLPDNQIQLLRDDEATKKNILTNADRLFRQANPDDLIIVYFSGHGGPNFFYAHDQPLKYEEIKNIVEASSAKKKLCIADACYSGTWSKSATVNATQKTLNNTQLEALYYDAMVNANNGIALFMSSSRNETSLESSNFGQGLFTYYLIKGLKGEADKNGNKIVTIKELFDFVKYSVSTTATNLFNHNQTPVINGSYDSEMPIGVVRN